MAAVARMVATRAGQSFRLIRLRSEEAEPAEVWIQGRRSSIFL